MASGIFPLARVPIEGEEVAFYDPVEDDCDYTRVVEDVKFRLDGSVELRLSDDELKDEVIIRDDFWKCDRRETIAEAMSLYAANNMTLETYSVWNGMYWATPEMAVNFSHPGRVMLAT